MPTITLPDGSQKSFPAPVSAKDVALSIGPKLAAAAMGCKVDGELSDLSRVLDHDCKLEIITYKQRDGQISKDALYLVRHSAAHIMAEAIQRIVPGAELVYGPPLEDKFYYDIRFPEDRPLREGDFPAIEAEMKKIIAEDRPFTRYEMDANEGLAKVNSENNIYKCDNAARALLATTANVPKSELVQVPWLRPINIKRDGNTVSWNVQEIWCKPGTKLSFYATGTPGKNWEDLCRGPHVPSTARVGAIKLLTLASSYWHGDENSDRLTRVYGTAFSTQAELDEYMKQREEAAKRDHKVIGKNLRLYHIDEDVGQGLILWTPNGSIVRKELQNFIAAELRKQGYTEVFTPHIGRLELYKTSGHFPYYKDSQFPPIVERQALEELSKSGCTCSEMIHRVEGVSARLAAGINERTKSNTITKDRVLPDEQLVDGFMLKPMNCPHHAKIFASAPHSYRTMPVRLAEFGTVYRWEQSGELNGLTRVRGFTQDDAHLFCTEEQVPGEIQGCLSLVKIIFNVLGMKDYRVRVGLRDPDSSKFTGSPESWDKAEAACIAAAQSLGVSFSKEPGEAAFYGPKIDFVVKDVIGREWQLGTVQVDYQMANRFDLSYIGADNASHRPVVIHRAPFGSMERFCGVLIEHFAGAFPLWLSPEQVRVLPISEKSADYARRVLQALRACGLRATLDDSNDRIQGKVKVAADEKIPYMAIVGPRDAENNAVSVRVRGIEKDLGSMPLDKFVEALKAEYESKSAVLGVKP